MLKKFASLALALVPRVVSQTGCSCPGCHLPRLKRMEVFNSHLAQVCDEQRREIDSLRRELDDLRRERGEVERAA